VPHPRHLTGRALARASGGRWAVLAGILTAVSLGGGLPACSRDTAAPPSNTSPVPPPANPAVVNEEDGTGGTLKLALVAPDTIDPAQIVPTDPAEVITADLLFDGLTSIDPKTSQAVAAVAERWEPNESLTSWTFHLRADATFSNSTPLTAADVKFSLERVVQRGKLSLAGPRLDVVGGFTELQAGTATEMVGLVVVDDRTLKVDLLTPYAGLPELVASASFGIVSKEVFTSGVPAVALSGGFTLTERDATRARLERRPGANVRLDAVEMIRYTDDEAAWKAFRDGAVNWVLVPASRHDEAVADFGTAAFTPLGATAFIGFNLVDPKFVDPRFRKAILRALDRVALAKVAPIGRATQTAIVPPGVPGAVGEDCGTACRQDIDEAKRLLAEAFPNGVYPAVALAVPEGGAEKLVADEVLRQLADVNVPVIVATMPFEQYRVFSTSGQQQMFWYGWAGLFPDPDAYLGRLFLTASKDNVTGFHSEDIDSAIRDARGTADRAERLRLYGEIERRLVEEAAVIPVSAYELEAAVSAQVRNFRWRLDGTFVVGDVWVKPTG